METKEGAEMMDSISLNQGTLTTPAENETDTRFTDPTVFALDHAIKNGEQWEGNIPRAYLDPGGHPHAGIGFLLSKNGVPHAGNLEKIKRHLMQSTGNEKQAAAIYDAMLAQGEELQKYRADAIHRLGKRGGQKELQRYQYSDEWVGRAVQLPDDVTQGVFRELMQEKQKEVLNLYEDVNLNYLQMSVLMDLQFQGPALIKKNTRFYKAVTDPAGPRWHDAIWEVLYDSGYTCNRNRGRAEELDRSLPNVDGDLTKYPLRPFPPGVSSNFRSPCA